MNKKINYLLNVSIEWTITGDGFARRAEGKYKDWTFTVLRGDRGGWNITINGIQAWTHMRGFDEAVGSVKDKLRNWAYMDQFRN
jgi:hypothetical protein